MAVVRLILRDLRMVFRSKLVAIVFLLAFAPVLTAIAARDSACSDKCLWSAMALGSSLFSINVYAWSWLVVPLLSALIFSVDMAEGMVYYVLSRGVSRLQYILSKLASLVATIGLAYCLGLLAGVMATVILGGSVDLSAAGYAAAYLLSSMPLALVTAILVVITGSMGKAVLLAIGGWLSTNIVASLAGLTYSNDLVLVSLIKSASPFSDPRTPVSLLYSAVFNESLVSGGVSIYVTLRDTGQQGLGALETVPSLGDAYLALLLAAVWTVLLAAILSVMVAKRDF